MGLHLLRRIIPEGMNCNPHSDLVRSWLWLGGLLDYGSFQVNQTTLWLLSEWAWSLLTMTQGLRNRGVILRQG